MRFEINPALCRPAILLLFMAMWVAILKHSHMGNIQEACIPLTLACLSLAIVHYDLTAQRIPNVLNMIIFLLGLLNNPYVLSSFFLGTLALALRWGVQKVKRKQAFGMGDVKLMYALGLWIPFWRVPGFLIWAGTIGTVFGMCWRQRFRVALFPFAPPLIAAFLYPFLFKLETFKISGILKDILNNQKW